MRIPSILATLFLAAINCFGQLVTVEVVSERDQIIPGETLVVGIRIVNQSGRVLHFGQDSAWLDVLLQDGNGQVIPKSYPLPIKGEFEVPNASRVTRRFDLSQAYEINDPGGYKVFVQVKVRENGWSEDLGSRPLEFNVFKPTTMWKKTIGIPPRSDRPEGPPQTRVFSLEQAHFFKRKMKFYLRVTSEQEERTYMVREIDEITNFSKWYAKADSYGNLHVLHQTPRAIARAYNYSVFDPNGQMLIRQTHHNADSFPRLYVSESGLVRVRGGRRVIEATDYPPREESVLPPEFSDRPATGPNSVAPLAPVETTPKDKSKP